jgi:hypothetical protein
VLAKTRKEMNSVRQNVLIRDYLLLPKSIFKRRRLKLSPTDTDSALDAEFDRLRNKQAGEDWPAKDRPICSPALSQPPMFMSPMFMPGREALAFVFCVARSVPARVSQCTPVHETVSQWHHQYLIVYSDCHHPWLVVSPRLLLCFFAGRPPALLEGTHTP